MNKLINYKYKRPNRIIMLILLMITHFHTILETNHYIIMIDQLSHHLKSKLTLLADRQSLKFILCWTEHLKLAILHLLSMKINLNLKLNFNYHQITLFDKLCFAFSQIIDTKICSNNQDHSIILEFEDHFDSKQQFKY